MLEANVIKFTRTLGPNPTNPWNLTIILPREGFVNHQVNDNSLELIINQLRESRIADANLYLDDVCIGWVSIREHGNGGFHGKAVTMNGDTLFIKESIESPKIQTESRLSLTRPFGKSCPSHDAVGSEDGRWYYPQFQEFYNCGKYPGVDIQAFQYKFPPLVSLNVKSLENQKLYFKVRMEPLETDEVRKALEGCKDAENGKCLYSIQETTNKNTLVFIFEVKNINKPAVEELLQVFGYKNETKGHLTFSSFVADENAQNTWGDFKNFLTCYVLD